MTPPTSAPSMRRLGFGFGALLLVLLLTALLAEGMIRVVARPGSPLDARLRPYDPFAILVEPHGTAGYRPRPNTTFRYPNGTAAHVNAQRFRGPLVDSIKPAGTVRIVLLGGSTTFGWGVPDDQSIDAHLRALLPARLPGRRVEVINAALDGYDSWQLLERVRGDVLALDPDLLVVNEGVNDVRSAPLEDLVDADPRTLMWEIPLRRMRAEAARGGPFLRSRLKHASRLVQFAGLMRDQIRAVGRGTPRADPSAESRYPVYLDAADYFERNMRAIGALARARGIAVLYGTPASSLRTNHQPTDRSTITYWLNDAEETQVYRDTLAARLQGATEAMARDGLVTAYVRPEVPSDEFLDDAHLTNDGNRRVAGIFADAIVPLLAAKER